MRLLSLLLLAAATACGRHETAKGPANPKIAAPAAVHAACVSELGSPGAKVRVWRDKDGIVQRLELQPDPAKVSDAGSVFFDAAARQVGRMPSGPTTTDAVNAAQAQLAPDLTAGETIGCATAR